MGRGGEEGERKGREGKSRQRERGCETGIERSRGGYRGESGDGRERGFGGDIVEGRESRWVTWRKMRISEGVRERGERDRERGRRGDGERGYERGGYTMEKDRGHRDRDRGS